MATLKDIAKRLDMSITQVSRALNDHSDVNEDTRDRVKRAARAMNYHPNLSARKLVSGRSGIVGLVVPQSDSLGTDGIFLQVVSGLSAQFSGRGMQFVLHLMGETEPVLPVYQRLIGNGALDGFVLIDPQDDDPRVAFLQRAGLPFVVHGRTVPVPDYPYFDIENESIFKDLTDHALSLGHRRIALVNGVAGRCYVTARSNGFAAAVAASGPGVDGIEVFGEMTEAHGLISTMGLFSGRGPAPTAILCGNVRIAKGVYQALEALGLSVPRDVSVMAHDDHLPNLRASAFFPSLTVTKAPLSESWKPLADALAGAIDGRVLEELQLVGRHEFIPRNSVAAPKS
ncbi:MAG: LacI family transcriptional regulator [Tabrizicola sp.]|nr:LacI family transcriptional regulator [Tabrizicola sp.]